MVKNIDWKEVAENIDWEEIIKSKNQIISEYTKWKICSILVPGEFLLWTKLWNWYEKNPYHKFDKWDILILRCNALGYWIRPVAIVNWYIIKEEFWKKVWRYDITMHWDTDWDFMKWIKENWIPEWVNRESNEWQIHFKWNIENQFKKVDVGSPEEALALY